MIVVIRPLNGRLHVMMPYLGPPKNANRRWFKNAVGRDIRPLWDGQKWQVSRAHFPVIVDALRGQFGEVHIFEDHSHSIICNTSCQDAIGNECSCRCLGENHGIGSEEHGYQRDRKKWTRIGDDVLVGQEGITRSHFVVGPDDFRPIGEWQNLGYEQYAYGKRYPRIIGFCYLCENPEASLVVDHCHEHGWIRDRICSPCNVSLGFIEKSERPASFGTVNSYDPDMIEQFTLCPDCSEIYFKVPPPHMRPNWRPGYYNELPRFAGTGDVMEWFGDYQKMSMRFRERNILEALATLSGKGA